MRVYRLEKDAVERSCATRFAILGPLEVFAHGRQLHLGARKQQLVLAALLCSPNLPVPVDALVDTLWPDSPPRSARKNIQVHVSMLRSLLGAAGQGQRISHQADGYAINVSPAELDSLLFEQRVQAAQKLWRVNHPAEVAHELRQALELWRGPVLAGMQAAAGVEAAAQRLGRMFLGVFEDWAEAELATGGALAVVERITDIARRHPLRERLRMLQMTALFQAGRRAEALAVYDELRRSLAGELGLAPGEAVARLHRSLLAAEPASPPADWPVSQQVTYCPVPRDLPAFTGRADCTRCLQDEIAGGARLVVLTGPVGAGKTALAVHTAHLLSGQFPDGRFFVRLRDWDGTARAPGDALAELTSAAGLPGLTRKFADARREWQRWLAAHRCLIVLDDARREPDVRPLLPETGDSVVIITARSRLAGLAPAFRFHLPPFTMAEGVRLLERHIGAQRVAADPRAAEQIVIAAGMLPLGVHLAGERLAGLRHVPLREFLARLDNGPAPLDELAAGDVALRARLADAIADLPAAAGHAFARLGLLPEPVFTLAEATAVLEVGEDAATQALEVLLDASVLVTPEQEVVAQAVIYEMPAIAHAYARELALAGPAIHHRPQPAAAAL
jgi:DNA-binding SARP family transcriptional activator